jgi:RNA polymerase sigma-70 factor (ECF subfamily)
MADRKKLLESLVDGCRNGDSRSQLRVYELLYGKMKAVCSRYTNNNDQAEDLLQEGFIKVFTGIEKYSGDGSFEGWVRRIMVNTAIDYFRKSKKDFVLMDDESTLEEMIGAEEEEEEENEVEFTPQQIVQAMQELTPAYRTIFNLYVFENLSHKEIADQIGISVGTSKSNLAKAKRNLKRILLSDYNRKDG